MWRPSSGALPFLLPFPCNKEQQTAASSGTKRRSKIAGFYEWWRAIPAASGTRPQRADGPLVASRPNSDFGRGIDACVNDARAGAVDWTLRSEPDDHRRPARRAPLTPRDLPVGGGTLPAAHRRIRPAGTGTERAGDGEPSRRRGSRTAGRVAAGFGAPPSAALRTGPREGRVRHSRYANDVWLGRLQDLHTRAGCHGRRPAQAGRSPRHRQGDPWRVRVWLCRSVSGPIRSPYDPRRHPSGSSGGTGAGIAADFAVAGIGGDTGGSVRGPAAVNSLVGLRPTLPLVSRAGSVPFKPSYDAVGPLTRTVMDTARVMDVIAGYDPSDPVTAYAVGRTPRSYAEGLVSSAMSGPTGGRGQAPDAQRDRFVRGRPPPHPRGV